MVGDGLGVLLEAKCLTVNDDDGGVGMAWRLRDNGLRGQA